MNKTYHLTKDEYWPIYSFEDAEPYKTYKTEYTLPEELVVEYEKTFERLEELADLLYEHARDTDQLKGRTSL